MAEAMASLARGRGPPPQRAASSSSKSFFEFASAKSKSLHMSVDKHLTVECRRWPSCCTPGEPGVLESGGKNHRLLQFQT